jgi:hypothetical protein
MHAHTHTHTHTHQKIHIHTYAHTRGRVVVESVKVTEIPEAGEGEWPLEPFCDDMCHDLFDAQWEVRHGAAMAVRDVLKYHATCAGRYPHDHVFVCEFTYMYVCILYIIIYIYIYIYD